MPSCRLAAWQCPTGAPPPCNGPRTPAISPRSIAVLYLANWSADSTDAYLADGLTEEIIARLSRINRLEVKSRTAVERFRRTSAPPDSLGRALRVAHLVSGTMQHIGRQLRVTVELVRASTGVTTWASRFDRGDEDLLDIETAIADTIAREVAGRLLPAECGALASRPTRNPEAYDRFVRGNYRLGLRTPEDTRLAIREHEAAVQLDPRFAAVRARIALAYGVALDWGWPGFDGAAAIRAGLAASSRALELDSTLADGWTARGYVLRFANAWTYAGVRESFAAPSRWPRAMPRRTSSTAGHWPAWATGPAPWPCCGAPSAWTPTAPCRVSASAGCCWWTGSSARRCRSWTARSPWTRPGQMSTA